GGIRGHLEKGELEVRAFARPGLRGGAVPSGEPYQILRVPAVPGHAGGADALMRAFVDRLRRRKARHDPGDARTSLQESLDSHLMAFAAEEARRAAPVVSLGGFARR